jgi:hypothetical protein
LPGISGSSYERAVVSSSLTRNPGDRLKPVTTAAILERALDGERISDEDAATLLRSRDLVAVGRVANEIRNRKTDPSRVTFIIDRNGPASNCAQYEPNVFADMQSTSTHECSSPSSIFAGMLSLGLRTHSSSHTFSPSARNRSASGHATALSFEL